jgi:iron complex outermembrane receptor protein
MKNIQQSALAIAIGAALFNAPQMAVAQEASAEKDDMEVIEVTATGRVQRMEEIPYNISAISGAELVNNQINNETDLLRNLSGVGVVDRGYRASGNVNSITIRGLNIDGGQRGDNASNAAASVSTYIGNTPMYANFIMRDINRVEVLRGPQGTLYGSSSLGGTIRFIPNAPEMDYTYGSVTADISQTSGSGGINNSLDVITNIALSDNFAFRANIGKIDNDGYIDYVNAYQLNDHGEPLINTGSGCTDPRGASGQQIVGNVVAVRDSYANGYTPGSAPGVEPIGVGCFKGVDDANTVDIIHGRIAAKWQASDNFNATLAYQYQKIETGGRSAITPGDNSQPMDSLLYQEYGDDDIGYVLLEPSEDEAQMASLDLEWDLGVGTLTSTTSWYNTTGYNERDNGGLWSGGSLDNLYTGWSRPAQRTIARYENEAIVQELRLTSEAGKKFDWIVGVFYSNEDKKAASDSLNPGMANFWDTCTTDPSVFAACEPFAFYGLNGLFDTDGNYLENTENDFVYRRNENFQETAIYGEFNYRPIDKLEFTLGIRWFDNTAITDGTFGFPIFAPQEGGELPPGFGFLELLDLPEYSTDEDGFLFKLNASYKLTESAMIYGTVSEGFRRGGVNAVVSSDAFPIPEAEKLQVYEKDTVINYELGVKGLANDISYTVSAFYIDWQDPQINTATDYGFLVALNGESAATYGIESEILGQLLDEWTYRLGYTYTQAELAADFMDPRDNGNLIAEDGDVLPGTPEHVFNASLSKVWDLGRDFISARISVYYQGESKNSVGGKGPFAQTFDSFAMTNASVSYIYDDSWTFTLYGKNLTDEAGTTGAQPCATRCTDHRGGVYEGWYGNANIEYISQPRTFGLSANYEF